MPSRPSLQKLKSKLYTYLTSKTAITTIATVSPTHPLAKADLAGKGRVVITGINDLGLVSVGRAGSLPSIQFACWDATSSNCDRLREVVINTMDEWIEADLTMVGQKVNSAHLENIIDTDYESVTGLYVSSVEYRFSLTLV